MNTKTAGIIFNPVKSQAKGKDEIKKLIEESVKNGITHFICSPASEAEIFAAEYILSRNLPGLYLECVIPFEEVATVWSEPLRNRFFEVMKKCDKETLLQIAYSDDCILKKNEYISSNANLDIPLNK